MIEIKFGHMLLISDGGVWLIGNVSGEAMEIGEDEMEKILFRYMYDNFNK